LPISSNWLPHFEYWIALLIISCKQRVFFWRNFAKLWFEEYDFNLHRGFFHGKKWPKFARFSNKKVSWLPYFDDKFQQVVKNINGFYFFPTFISSLSPNLAKSSYRWSPLQLHHKIEKTKTHACKQRRPILVRCTTVIWQKPSTEMRLGR
jgi:hypothetical protein